MVPMELGININRSSHSYLQMGIKSRVGDELHPHPEKVFIVGQFPVFFVLIGRSSGSDARRGPSAPRAEVETLTDLPPLVNEPKVGVLLAQVVVVPDGLVFHGGVERFQIFCLKKNRIFMTVAVTASPGEPAFLCKLTYLKLEFALADLSASLVSGNLG